MADKHYKLVNLKESDSCYGVEGRLVVGKNYLDILVEQSDGSNTYLHYLNLDKSKVGLVEDLEGIEGFKTYLVYNEVRKLHTVAMNHDVCGIVPTGMHMAVFQGDYGIKFISNWDSTPYLGVVHKSDYK